MAQAFYNIWGGWVCLQGQSGATDSVVQGQQPAPEHNQDEEDCCGFYGH